MVTAYTCISITGKKEEKNKKTNYKASKYLTTSKSCFQTRDTKILLSTHGRCMILIMYMCMFSVYARICTYKCKAASTCMLLVPCTVCMYVCMHACMCVCVCVCVCVHVCVYVVCMYVCMCICGILSSVCYPQAKTHTPNHGLCVLLVRSIDQ